MSRPPAPAVRVHHRPEVPCFEAEVEGQRCELAYELRGGVIWWLHTGVPPALEGRGIAGELAAAGLAYAREQGLKVVPACRYMAAYMQRHPETQDLLAPRT